MANNWYTRLLKNIIGRSSNTVSSKGELRLKRLEDRRLLNAEFSLVGGDLILQNFDLADLTISEGSEDLDGLGPNLAEDVYLFTLSAGTWSEVGGTGLDPNNFELLSGDTVLAVGRDLFDGTNDLLINDTIGGADVNISFADAGANVIDFIAGTTIGITDADAITQGTDVDLQVETLTLTNVGDVTLDENGNDFNTFTATSRGFVTVTDADDLAIGATGITTDIDDLTDGMDDNGDVTISAGGNLTISGAIDTTGDMAGDVGDDDITLTTTSGTITVNAALNAGNANGVNTGDIVINSASTITLNGNVTGDNVRLDAEGDISQTGGTITAESLSALQDSNVAGSVTLLQANDVDVFAARNDFATGSVSLRSTVDLSLGTVNTIAGVTTDNGDIDLQSDMTLTVDVTLLNNTNDGDVFLHGGTNVDLSAALDTGAGDLLISDGNDLDVNQILTSTGIIRLQANGNITQSAVINAGTLAAQQLSNAAGAITLNGNNVVNNFAASNAFDTGGISFNNTQSLAIAAVAALPAAGIRPAFAMTPGVNSTNGAIAITNTTGNMTVTGTVSAGTSTVGLTSTAGTLAVNNTVMGSNVTLTAAGNISQTAAITATGTLNAVKTGAAAGNITLTNVGNMVGTFTASNAGAAGTISFVDADAINVGAITSNNGAILVSNVTGNMTVTGAVAAGTGTVGLTSAGTLAVDSTVAGSTVTLASMGDITQTGVITATTLTANQNSAAAGNITLNAANMVGTFNATNLFATGTIAFNDADAINVGAVTSNNGNIAVTNTTGNMTVTGAVAAGTGTVGLTSAGTLAVNNTVAGSTVTLASMGNITQMGVITATTLTANQNSAAAGNITLNAANMVGTFNASNLFAGGTIAFTDADAINVGAITSTNGNIAVTNTTGNMTVTGAVAAGTGTVGLTSAGTLAVNNTVAGSTVTLSSMGNITQTSVITATTLNANQMSAAAGNITLNASNMVGAFTASNLFVGGTIEFNNILSLIVGNVSTLDGAITIIANDGVATNTANVNVNGLVTSIGAIADGSDGTIDIFADGTLTLDLDASFDGLNAGTVINSGMATTRLFASGAITQDTDGLITAAVLGVRQASTVANTNVILCEMNSVGSFASSNDSTGGSISFRSGLSFTTGTVSAFGGDVNDTDGVTTMNGPISLQSDATLTIAAAPFGVNANGGSISLIGGTDVILTEGLNTGAGNIFISDGGALALNQTLTTTGTVRLQASGAVSQTVGAIITANELAVRQELGGGGNDDLLVDLSSANVVNEFAAFNNSDGGQIEFNSVNTGGTLTIGGVTAFSPKGVTFNATNGVTTTFTGAADTPGVPSDRADILIQTTGNLNLAVDGLVDNTTGVAGQTTAFSAGSGNADVRLIAGGAVTQDIDGLIIADEVGVRLIDATEVATNQDIALGFGNTVNEFAARNQSIGGAVTFQSVNNLTVGAVTEQVVANVNIAFAATTGIFTTSTNTAMDATDTSNDVLIEAGGFLSLDEAIDTNNNRANDTDTLGLDADVRLIANGDIAQDAEGVITANELGVLQRQSAFSTIEEIGATDMAHDVDLGFLNNVDEVAINNVEAGSEINFQSTRNLTVGTVTSQIVQGANFEQTAGMADSVIGVATNSGNILIESDQALSLDLNNTFDAMGTGTAVNSGTATTRLVAQGDIRQDSDGLITANALGVRQNAGAFNAAADLDSDPGVPVVVDNAHNVDLGYVNSVNTFAASNAYDANLNGLDTQGGTITFQSGNNLTIGTVTANPAVNPMDGSAFFAATTGVSTTNTGAAVVSRDTDGDGTFETLDVLAGDILIETSGTLGVNSAVNAGAGASDVRLAANGAITQTAIITADELNVRQDAIAMDTAVTLTMANVVNEFAAFNASDNGNLSFTSAGNLNINVLTPQGQPHATVSGAYSTFATNGTRFDMNAAPMTQPVANVAVGASGGNITIQAGMNLAIIGVTDVANQRMIFSTDGTVDTSMATDGEMITLNANNNITLGQNVIITTDENMAALASSATTSDQILIQADSDNNSVDPITDGAVIFGDGLTTSGVQLRTDGGVAIALAMRPDNLLANPTSAFFQGTTNPIAASIAPTSTDGGLTTAAAFQVTIGVVGEENLRVNIDWQDTGDAINVNPADFPVLAGVDNVIDSQPTLTNFLAQGNQTLELGHVYTVLDVNNIVNNSGGTATVQFGVVQHESILVTGGRIEQNGSAQNVFEGALTQTSDNNPATMNTAFENGRAEFNFVNTPILPILNNDPAPEPNPAPANPEPIIGDVPLAVFSVEPPVASRVGVSSQSFDFFQLRRNEGDEGYVLIDEKISEDNGESLLDPRSLREYIEENDIPDEQDYELWLITTKVNNSGQAVTLERPILKFDVSGGRPIPAVEDLPMEFPELKLIEIPIDVEGEAEPVENTEMNEADSEKENQDKEKMPETKDENVSLIEGIAPENSNFQRIDGSHQTSAIAVGSVLAVSNLNRVQAATAGRKVRNRSILSRFFGGQSTK